MTKCERCHAEIPDTTDDNYNAEHDQIQCPECKHWQGVDWEAIAEAIGRIFSKLMQQHMESSPHWAKGSGTVSASRVVDAIGERKP